LRFQPLRLCSRSNASRFSGPRIDTDHRRYAQVSGRIIATTTSPLDLLGKPAGKKLG
jgi:hypothetical protein